MFLQSRDQSNLQRRRQPGLAEGGQVREVVCRVSWRAVLLFLQLHVAVYGS